MYSLAIYLYMLCANVVALFDKKARFLMRGHRQTWKILRSQIEPDAEYLWFHAASLGEFEQGRPLIELIRARFLEKKILLTFFSPSGYEVRKDYKGADVCCYLPFDTMLNSRKFMRLARPKMAFFIKYEFWQNYLTRLSERGIPTYSVSSIFRPNQIFFRSYGKHYAEVLRCFTHLFVQNEESRRLLAGKGIGQVTVVGDTRLDRVLTTAKVAKEFPLIEAFAKGAEQVVMAGSSWPDDEGFLIDYFNAHPGQKLMLAPHVVEESHLHEIESRLTRPALRLTKATEQTAEAAECLIIDCYGVLASAYRYATIAYVGGGFGVGIHNVPEAAVYGIPVIIGPNNGKFKEAQDLKRVGGVMEIETKEAYAPLMDRLTAEPQLVAEAGARARQYIKENSGAVDKIFDFVFKQTEA